MILKEYRILLPLTVDEYRIAQLYMIAKKSRQDTSGAGSGVEIIKNEPYENGPGGKGGQYTYKVFHIGNHLPAWFRGILPKSALMVEEEAWNAYPYTKTRYTCPFVEKLLLEVETRYFNDAGTQENVFDLDKKDLSDRIVDYMDIVKDPISVMEYAKEEDPKLYQSERTGRGPLEDDWVDDCVQTGKPIMCAYKLCRVEFRYWGMQSRIEKFIHDIALRKTMVRAHRQAWAWQDEWYGLTIEDIRQMERETQEILNEVMRKALMEQGELTDGTQIPQVSVTVPTPEMSTTNGVHTTRPASPTASVHSHATSSSTTLKERFEAIRSDSEDSQSVYFDAVDSPTVSHKPSIIRWSSVEAVGVDDDVTPPLSPAHTPRSQVGLLLLIFHGGSPLEPVLHSYNPNSYFSTDPQNAKLLDVQTFRSTVDTTLKQHYPELIDRVVVQLVPCPNFTAGALNELASLCPYGGDMQQALSDGCCHPALISLVASESRAYQDALQGAVAKANRVYDDFVKSDDGRGFCGEVCVVADAMGGLLAYDILEREHRRPLTRHASSVSATSDVSAVIKEGEVLNDNMPAGTSGVHSDDVSTLRSFRRMSDASTDEESEGSLSSVRYALRPSNDHPCHRFSTSPSPLRQNIRAGSREDRLGVHPGSSNHSSSPTHEHLQFKVSNLFLCGTPLATVLVQRKLAQLVESTSEFKERNFARPHCDQVYNLYYPMDRCAARLEPLLCRHWQRIVPLHVPRYCRYPLGDGQPVSLIDYARRHRDELLSAISCDVSVSSGAHAVLNHALTNWWGNRRVDYAIYCPEGLAQFPSAALPNILHASYWESTDVVAFILRQFILADESTLHTPVTVSQLGNAADTMSTSSLNALRPNDSGLLEFTPSTPIEKWTRRRTSFKIKNAQSNHRANDVIANEVQPQVLSARFMYGPLDVVALSGERVDVYVRKDSIAFDASRSEPATSGASNGPPTASCSLAQRQQWIKVGTETTDSSGRLIFQIPDEWRLGLGVHPVKMVVRGDHTYLDMYLAVVPPETQCVVFSIDGSFTASVSVSGKDPKVRPGAVDVVRMWQDLGFLILYITARPDIQQRQVVSWLAQHNFPHGLLFFTGGISTDPLRQKTLYLQKLTRECGVSLKAGYGSAKDIHVYASAGLPSDRIFVVGKCGKKSQSLGHCLADGYAAHLTQLMAGSLQALAQPAHGNGRMVLRKGYFSVPGQYYRAAVAVQRSQSFTPRSGKYHQPQVSSMLPPGSPASVADRTGYSLDNTTSSLNSTPSFAKSRGLSPFRLSHWNRKV